MRTATLHTKARITAFGVYVPEKVITNDDLAKLVDTNHDWIVQRTGMIERRMVDEHVYASDIAQRAIEHMSKTQHVDLNDVDALIVATTTPDAFFPSTAAITQAKLGIPNCSSFDVSNACAGFVTALQVAIGLIDSGMHRKVIVVGAEVLTRTVDYTDRSTCILFGDGAGAMLLEADPHPHTYAPCFIASSSHTMGDLQGTLYRSAIANQINGIPLKADGTMVQNGREVYKWALSQIPKGMHELMKVSGYSLEQVDCFVPHSANLRMIESLCERSGISIDNTLTSVQYFGNTSAASIPLALAEGIKDGRLQQNSLVLLYGFGGGLSQSGLLLHWPLPSQ
ncbi:ketoacyl-ACP synthase III [Paenibacillus sp. 481]|uniref:ketoacyl-ACP synthase III n=1 Tax=Paenibacillus sp. 481 TaxID=2835869 RepID=UPI001E37503A|nr:ketoacyl-ACP synthase III [Paenibacillus sp. 481]UHA74477.1 ketoacyl-ACP synthase III [Paenibacillus sp. 481]